MSEASSEGGDVTLTDDSFLQQAVAGGASRHYTSGHVPDRGFMVGGARNHKDIPYPEISHEVDSITLDHVRHHAREIRDHFGEGTSVHQGAWVEDGNVVLDASDRHDNFASAMTAAKMRGERAVYDVRRGREHHVSDLEGRVKN